VNQETKSRQHGGKRAGAGRPKGRSPHLYNLDAYYALAHEALEDGRLVLTVQRAAFALGCNEVSIRALIKEGDLPCVYVPTVMNKRVIFDPRIPCTDLLEWVERRSTHATLYA
jgi:hypothetical protein